MSIFGKRRIKTPAECYLQAESVLGICGRMIAGSKTMYRDRHPDNMWVFNANVCIAKGKIWHGDLDVTFDEPKLKDLAEALGEKIYVLRESDARFDNEEKPLLKNAVWTSE